MATLEQRVSNLTQGMSEFGAGVTARLGSMTGIEVEILDIKKGMDGVLKAAQNEFIRMNMEREASINQLADQIRAEFVARNEEFIMMKGECMGVFGEVHAELGRLRKNNKDIAKKNQEQEEN